MRAVVQRVEQAEITVEGELISRIGRGLAVLVAVETGDTDADQVWMRDKLLHLRIFEDEEGKLNRSLREVGGSLLLVSQFTLLGDAKKGRRPNFMRAAAGEVSQRAFDALAAACAEQGIETRTGQFGAHMKFSLTNDGPVTILLDSRRPL